MAHTFYSMEMPNAKLVRQGLENLSKAIPEVGRSRMQKLAKAVSAHYSYTATNPPKHGKYVRTFALRGARRIMKEKLGYVLVINPVGPRGQLYGLPVLGDMRNNSQARQHRGTWLPLRAAVLEETAKLPREIQVELGSLIAKETAKANK